MTEEVLVEETKPKSKKKKPAKKAEAPVFAAIGQAMQAIHDGIAEGDWSKVSEGYAMLSGQEPPHCRHLDALAMLQDMSESLQHFLGGNSQATIPARRRATQHTVEQQEPPEKEYRPKFEYLKFNCTTCGKEDLVHPGAAPRRLDAQDETPRHFCNKCIVQRRGK